MKSKLHLIIGLFMLIILLLAEKKCYCQENTINDTIGQAMVYDSLSEISLIDTSKIVFDTTDIEIFYSLADSIFATGADSLPINELYIWIANYFSDCEYIKNTVTANVINKMVINLRGFDCVTLVEAVMALASTFNQHEKSFITFTKELEKIRYRDGVLGEYQTRLHYFTDWIYDNQKRKIVNDVTMSLDSIPYVKTINFMTKNRHKYDRLAKDDGLYNKMLKVEKDMATRKLYYIPKDKIPKVVNKIIDGDIIVFTTSITGLDVSHVGFAVHKEGKLHLMHASSQGKKVITSERPLTGYTAGKKYQSGIIVVRVKDTL